MPLSLFDTEKTRRRDAVLAGLTPASTESVNLPRIWTIVVCVKEQ